MPTIKRYPNTTLSKIPSYLNGDHTSVDEDPTTPDSEWISFGGVALPDVEFVSATSASNDGTNNTVTINKPANVQAGDLLVFGIATASSTNGISGLSISGQPAGLLNIADTAGIPDVGLYLKQRFVKSTDPASYTVTVNVVGGTLPFAVACAAYRNATIVASETSFTTAGSGPTTPTQTLTVSAITPASAPGMLVRTWAVDGGEFITALDPPAGMNERASAVPDGIATGKGYVMLADKPFSTTSTLSAENATITVSQDVHYVAASLLLMRNDGALRARFVPNDSDRTAAKQVEAAEFPINDVDLSLVAQVQAENGTGPYTLSVTRASGGTDIQVSGGGVNADGQWNLTFSVAQTSFSTVYSTSTVFDVQLTDANDDSSTIQVTVSLSVTDGSTG